MIVNLLKIRNVMGIDELVVKPGSVTIAEGRNDSGKTSFIEGIKSLVQGGHDGTLLRHGAEEGEVVILLDDATTMRKRIREQKSDLHIEREGGVRRAPQSYMDNLTNAVALNPVAFINPPGAKTPESKGKAQAKMLLDAFPVEIAPEEIIEALDGADVAPPEGGGLEGLERTGTELYNARTGVNRLAKEHKGALDQLEKTIDPEWVQDDQPLATVEALEANLTKIEAERNTQHRELDREVSAQVEKIRADAAEEIEALKEQIRERERVRDLDIEREKDDYRETVEQLTAGAESRAADAKEKLGAAKEAAKQYERQQDAIAALEEQRAKLQEREQESEALSAAIERLDALKVDALARLPLQGVEIRDGMLYRGDTPFHRLNTAKQWDAAINLATHVVGDLPIICADGLERLDSKNYEAFVERVKTREVHLFATRVTDDDFHIRTEG